VLAAFGLYPVASILATTPDDAVSVARVLGFPVVAKLFAPGLVHKTEVGGVRAHLADEAAVERAFQSLSEAATRHGLTFAGVTMQAMAGGAIETMVGVVRDETFGPLVGFGLGGTEVELLGDMQFGLAPLSDRDVADVIERSRAHVLIGGYRGRPPADRDALTELLLRVSALADAVPELLELDLNPVMVMSAGLGVQLVDVRIKVASPRN
jgi:acyl-CoA synthetase (NDP forming)